MSIVIPGAAVNYPNALLAVGLNFNNSPAEGYRSLPAEISWNAMGGADKVVSMNAQTSGGTVQLSQICALHVDNSACGSDVQFVFTDTQQTYTVAAYTPYALFPVFSKSLQFYVIAGINNEIVTASDLTRFSMFNFVPPPIVIPTSQEQNVANVSDVSSATASTTLVAAGQNGTLEGAFIFFSANFANSGMGTWKLQDGSGTPVVFAQGAIQGSSGDKVDLILFNMTGLRTRFANGLYLVLSQTAVLGGTYSVNIYYRTP